MRLEGRIPPGPIAGMKRVPIQEIDETTDFDPLDLHKQLLMAYKLVIYRKRANMGDLLEYVQAHIHRKTAPSARPHKALAGQQFSIAGRTMVIGPNTTKNKNWATAWCPSTKSITTKVKRFLQMEAKTGQFKREVLVDKSQYAQWEREAKATREANRKVQYSRGTESHTLPPLYNT